MNHKQQESDLKYTTRMWLLLVGIPLLGICAIAVVATAVEAAPYQPHAERCFSADKWGPAPDSVRPCVRLVGNNPEAGAARFTVEDASGTVRYTGFVNTKYHRIAAVYIQRVWEDGSFRYCISNNGGRMLCSAIGNLQD